MHIRIFEPNPTQDRWNHWVVFFPDQGEPQLHNADSPEEAERIAADLAAQHGCPWKYMPDCPELPHWFDEEGNLRDIDRLEVVHLGNGRGQLNFFSGTVRLSTDMGDLRDLLELLHEFARDWGE
jgi:hypothetical protein